MDYHNLCPGCMDNKGTSKTCPHCGLPADAGPESALHLPPGTVLQDKYLLGRALGQGGFGITYLAWDLNLNLKLAIKEYLPQQLAYRTDGSTKVTVYKQSLIEEFSYGRKKFLEEAQTLARFIEHPNVVSVRDYFEANGTAYLVMHYHEGVTLQNYLADRGGKITVDQAFSIIMPVLDALGEVHRSGFMHRDISPDNILITDSGQVILIDFGAARQELRDKSKSLSVILKAGYAPEEQYRSRGKQGPWTDIYAAGATLYRAITGDTPPEAMDRLDEDDLVPPSQLDVDIKPNQEQALLKALAVKARNRYQSVEEFQRALVAVRDKGLPPQVAPVYSVSKRAVKAAALVFLGGLFIFGAVSLFSGGDEPSGPAVSETEEAAQTAAPAIVDDSDAIYYIDYENGNIPLGDLPIGARLVDPGWEWEFRTGRDYNREEGDQIKPVTWIVVAHDHYEGLEPHVTLLSEELIGRHAFSAEGRNNWGESDLRSWLNSAGFYQAFSESFKSAVLTTTLPNKEWENGSAYSTQDKVFISSTTELDDTEHDWTYQIGSDFPYFQGADNAKRVALLGDQARWYWTRSPASFDGAIVRFVTSTGAFYSSRYYIYYGRDGVRPALNLKSEILVSEVNP